MWKTDLEYIGIDTRSMLYPHHRPSNGYLCTSHFPHIVITGYSSHVKKILFHSKDFVGLLIYHLEYQTTQIPTGFVSVAISGGFCEN